jgi:hypothetical protein
VNEPLEDGVGLHGHCFPHVELLQGEYPQLHEKLDGIASGLFWRVGVLYNCLDFLTLLNSIKENSRGFGGRE